MVPVDTLVGYLVYIFTGGLLPFILRPNMEVWDKIKVIGGCHIQGIMNGEVVGSQKWREEGVILQRSKCSAVK